MGRGHRHAGYRLLNGEGIEIGALHAPAPLPKGCRVTYVDAITTDQARQLFPEVDPARLVRVDIIADLDSEGLSVIEDDAYDFAISNHVIEHVANPVNVLSELFRVVRGGGVVVLSVPDMRFTFDRNRKLTSNEHLLDEYARDVRSVSLDHYAEMVASIRPLVGPDSFSAEVLRARDRREHAHVWNSETFASFLAAAFEAAHISADLLTSSKGDSNRLEHFSVWRKRGRREASAVNANA